MIMFKVVSLTYHSLDISEGWEEEEEESCKVKFSLDHMSIKGKHYNSPCADLIYARPLRWRD